MYRSIPCCTRSENKYTNSAIQIEDTTKAKITTDLDEIALVIKKNSVNYFAQGIHAILHKVASCCLKDLDLQYISSTGIFSGQSQELDFNLSSLKRN
jgi:hypothetical protein